MEFMRQKNMRLVDLFTSLDTDGSKSLSRDEFKDGLKSVNIPMSSMMLDKLLNKLDADGDGEVRYFHLFHYSVSVCHDPKVGGGVTGRHGGTRASRASVFPTSELNYLH